MDWILNRTVEQSPLGVSIGREHFTDLDYADDVAFLDLYGTYNGDVWA